MHPCKTLRDVRSGFGGCGAAAGSLRRIRAAKLSEEARFVAGSAGLPNQNLASQRQLNFQKMVLVRLLGRVRFGSGCFLGAGKGDGQGSGHHGGGQGARWSSMKVMLQVLVLALVLVLLPALARRSKFAKPLRGWSVLCAFMARVLCAFMCQRLMFRVRRL